MKIPIFPGKYHQNGGFSRAMLVYRRVRLTVEFLLKLWASVGSSWDKGGIEKKAGPPSILMLFIRILSGFYDVFIHIPG